MYLFKSPLPEAPPVVDEVGRIALGAANYIREHGHCKNVLYDREKRACFVGAIYRAGGRGDYVEQISVRAGFSDTHEAVKWNNAPDTTGEQVIAALTAAAVQP